MQEEVRSVHVGIDVGKAYLDIHVHPLGDAMRVTNDARGHRALVARLASLDVALVVMEPTGRYHRAAHRCLHDAGLAVAVVDPLRARLFAQACGKRAKTDAIDAAALARMAAQLDPAPVAPPSQEQEALQELAGARQAAIAERIAIANRLGAAATPFLRRELTTRLRAIDRHLERLDAHVHAIVQADPELDRKASILRSIPGVGPVTTLAFLAQLAEIGRISGKQIASLAGLAPHPRESGTIQAKRRIQGGRAALRRALYMAALVASRRNPDMQRCYQNLTARGKPPKLALAAVARKIVVLANRLVAENRTWSPIHA